MSTMTAGLALFFFLPFLLSLFGRAAMPKLLCLLASVIAALLALKFYLAIVPWIVGMAIAAVSVRAARRQGAMPDEKRGGIAPAALNS
jgi:hypothetical protein